MADEQGPETTATDQADAPAPRKGATRAKKAAATPPDTGADAPGAAEPATASAEAPRKRAAKATAAKRTTKKAAAKAAPAEAGEPAEPATAEGGDQSPAKATSKATKKAPKKTAKKAAKSASKTASKTASKSSGSSSKSARTRASATTDAPAESAGTAEEGATATAVVFQAPDATTSGRRRRTRADSGEAPAAPAAEAAPAPAERGEALDEDDAEDGDGARRRRRRRGGRRRRKGGESGEATPDATEEAATDDAGDADGDGSTRRRRRRRRAGESDGDASDDPANTVTRVRQARSAEDQITAVTGSTRLEAKKQRRREGREAGRRRAPIVSEAEFLARRESVERVMVIRQREELTQIAVLEDKVLVEHYVARESQTSLIGNVYLGRVQNVLPSMEAAFIDIGKGRNAVLYAGEVNWSALGHPEGQPRKIESVLSSGQTVLVQVTKDPVGHKGARLTSQISLAGRFLVYVPDGTTSGISRKLPDTERNRLKTLLKEIVPDTAGVIVRTAAEGASEDELTRDVERLKARWEDIEAKSKGSAPTLLYGEPDLTLKVVRDLFTEDFTRLVIEGDDAWETVQGYVAHVAPDLEPRLQRYEPAQGNGSDVFAAHRIDEQIAKGLDRKVWLPSGGSLIIDRTEAMTVVDVNTGKFTGSGGNLEETVTKNNLEAAEEIVRQLRLRDIGGIIVVDFIDMVLESNRDLVLRRLVECLGRDRTRHQVAEVTSLGLVQMTRKRIGTGLLEAFSQPCDHCQGRGVVVHDMPVEPKRGEDESRRGRRGRGRGRTAEPAEAAAKPVPSPKDVAAHARPPADEPADDEPLADEVADQAELLEPLEAAEPAAEPVPEPVPEPVTEPVTEPVHEPVHEEETQPESSPEPDPEPESEPAPVVVTRSRRRSASRPAGPPAAPPMGDLGAPADHGAVEPGTAQIESAGIDSPDGVPPADESPVGEPVAVEHVPIKRKGGRKR